MNLIIRRLNNAFQFYLAVVRHRPKELFTMGFVVGVAMSAGHRFADLVLQEHGTVSWPWIQTFHCALRTAGWENAGVFSDIRNGVVLGSNFLAGPAIIAFAVWIIYESALWFGVAGVVAVATPRITALPHLDLLLWPSLAAIGQLIGLKLVFGKMERKGFRRAVVWVRNFGSLAGAVAGIAVVLLLLPALYPLAVAVQFGVEWLLQS